MLLVCCDPIVALRSLVIHFDDRPSSRCLSHLDQLEELSDGGLHRLDDLSGKLEITLLDSTFVLSTGLEQLGEESEHASNPVVGKHFSLFLE